MVNQMVYRANRDTRRDEPSELEVYGEKHMINFFRSQMAMPNPRAPGAVLPNYDFGPMIEAATRISEKIVRNSLLTSSYLLLYHPLTSFDHESSSSSHI